MWRALLCNVLDAFNNSKTLVDTKALVRDEESVSSMAEDVNQIPMVT